MALRSSTVGAASSGREEERAVQEAESFGTIVKGPKIGRNDPCPCGSGKKYKKCCGKNA